MLSNKKMNKQDTEINITDNEKELLSIYNNDVTNTVLKDNEEYIVFDEDDDKDYEYETYKIVLDDNSKDEEIDEEIIEEIVYDDKNDSDIDIEKNVVINNNEEDNNKIIIKKERKKSKLGYNLINKIINIVFIIIILLLLLISIDVILVGKYEIGPFLAIPTKKYNDGGSRAYYGIGYKVIKYNQKIGRRDKEIGNYSLKYNTTPIDIDSVDLAIEFTEDENTAYKKYYKKFVRVTGELTKVDYDNNKIKISYLDEDGKYAIDIICSMATKKGLINNLEINKEITVIGTVYNYDLHTDTKPTKLYIKNTFAEQ